MEHPYFPLDGGFSPGLPNRCGDTMRRQRRRHRRLRKKAFRRATLEGVEQDGEDPSGAKSVVPPRSRKRVKEPPDAGWSWVVLLGMSTMTTQSLFSISGLLFGQEIISWGYSMSEVAAVSTMMLAVQNFFGVVCGLALKKYSLRAVGVTGTTFVFSGLLCCSFFKELWGLFITWGLLVGIGMSMIVPTAFVSLTMYFERYRRYAVGIAMAGTGIGQMALPFVVRELLDVYGFGGACLILSSISLHALTGYALCRPIKIKTPPKEGASEPTTSQSRLATKESRFKRFIHAIGLPLLNDLSLLNTIITSGLIYMSVACHTAVLPLFMTQVGHLDHKLTATCLTVLSGCDLAGRLIMPIVQERFELSAQMVLITSSAIGAVFRSVMAEWPTLGVIVIASIFTGLTRAATVVNINLALAETVDRSHLMSVIGLSMVVKALCTLIVGSFLGWLHKLTDSYRVYLHGMTVVNAITTASWLAERIIMWKINKRRAAVVAEEISQDPPGNSDEGPLQTSRRPPEKDTTRKTRSTSALDLQLLEEVMPTIPLEPAPTRSDELRPPATSVPSKVKFKPARGSDATGKKRKTAAFQHSTKEKHEEGKSIPVPSPSVYRKTSVKTKSMHKSTAFALPVQNYDRRKSGNIRKKEEVLVTRRPLNSKARSTS